MKQDAVQSMVHDLRTPMTVIKGNLQLLLSGVMGTMTEEQILLLRRSVGPLEELILMTENLLQSSTLENDLTLKIEEADLDVLLSETIDFYKIPFSQREMQIYRHGNTFGTKVLVDTFWMKRVLNNLIWNAYKFTPDHGKVVIQVQHCQDGLELSVSDNGRGIPADKLASVFGKFTQTSVRDRKLGSGLGLWICKRVLRRNTNCI